MPTPLLRNIQRFLLSVLHFFLPMYCLGKLKNSEIATAFYCRHTYHLNFEGCCYKNNKLWSCFFTFLYMALSSNDNPFRYSNNSYCLTGDHPRDTVECFFKIQKMKNQDPSIPWVKDRKFAELSISSTVFFLNNLKSVL